MCLFNKRITSLTPTLRSAQGTLSEFSAGDIFQTVIIKLVEHLEAGPNFLKRPDVELITFANWRARNPTSGGRLYT